jgi:hypothetical protein
MPTSRTLAVQTTLGDCGSDESGDDQSNEVRTHVEVWDPKGQVFRAYSVALLMLGRSEGGWMVPEA